MINKLKASVVIPKTPFLISLAIFLFWFFISRHNYFHLDEWKYFMRMSLPPARFLAMSYNGHFIPLLEIYYYLMIKIFGLNYIPFQVATDLLHALNSLIIYLVASQLTKRRDLPLAAMILFGFSSVGVEVPVWSINVAAAAIGTFTYAAFYLLLKNIPKINLKIISISCLLLLIPPLWYDPSILSAFGFCFITLLGGKGKKRFSAAVLYAVTGFISVAVLLHFSNYFGVKNPLINPAGFARDYLDFVSSGIVFGLITRFILPNLYFFIGSNSFFGVWVRPLLFYAGLLAILIFLIKTARAGKIKEIIKIALLTWPLIILNYMSIALGRTSFGSYFARNPRYPYFPSFFLVLFIILLLNIFRIKRTVVYLLVGLFLALNLTSAWNFENNYILPDMQKDRKFIKEVTYLFTHNQRVINYQADLFDVKIQLSRLWFLPDYQRIVFLDPASNPKDVEALLSASDYNSQQIYSRIAYPLK